MRSPLPANSQEWIKFFNITKGQEWIIDNLILLHQSGSRLYGFATEESDHDYIGITIAPVDYWVGSRRYDQFIFSDKEKGVECTIFDVRKFIHLASNSNPSIIESLYVPKSRIVFEDWIWTDIIKPSADKLVSRQAFHTFNGYAHSQLHKLEAKLSNKTGRRDIVEEYGSDLKFGCHSFRLAWGGVDLLNNGRLDLPYPYADKLRDIRYGKTYPKGHLMDMLADLRQDITKLSDAAKVTKLPYSSDAEAVNKMLISVFEAAFDVSFKKD